MIRSLPALFIVVLSLSSTALYPGQIMDLSGRWEFRMDPQDVGVAEKWFEPSVPFPSQIAVPGAWNAQGMGTPSEKLFSDFPGPAWYRRTVDLTALQGRVLWLKFGGVHRYADVWINSKHVGEHIGYVAPFKFDVTGLAAPGEKMTIAVRVDARQRKDVDPLTGCLDIIDAVFLNWGGLYRGVELEATDSNWVEDVFVVPHIADRTAEVRVEIGKQGDQVRADRVIVRVTDQSGQIAGSGEVKLQSGETRASIPVQLFGMKLWSPSSPYLYQAKVALEQGGTEVDSRTVRFGMREIAVKDGQFLLNGEPIFLRGYGDDCVYPNTIAPPADKEEYYRRFRLAKDYGFNYVRHHSWFPLQEYFDVADELGIMLQPEFPIAYQEYYNQATPEGKKLYLSQWQEAIKAGRNHPSIITWSMANEMYNSSDIAPEMYKTAKELDPTRMVIESDGTGLPSPGSKSRDTLDFLSCQFDEGGRFGFNDGKYDVGHKPDKPVLVHEMSNFGTFPDLKQAGLFKGGIRPWWLYSAQDLAKTKGFTGVLPEWVTASNKLQAAALKMNIEAARKSPAIKGYHQWLLQDYWTGSNGVLDIFFRPKGISAEEFRRFNASTVLLMDCPKRCLSAGEKMTVTFTTSRYEDKPSQNASLTCRMLAEGTVLSTGTKTGIAVPSGGNAEVLKINFTMPSVVIPAKIVMEAELKDENGTCANSWDLWVFPTERFMSNRMALEGMPEVKQSYPDAVEPDSLAADGLLVARRLSPRVTAHLERGGRVLLLSADGAFPAVPSRFKPCWWLGDPNGDSNVGAVIAKGHPAMTAFRHEGWCDLQFYHLIEGSKAVLLDDLPVRIDPIVRCIDVHTTMRNKAYLFETKVGSGRLLVSSLSTFDALKKGDPAAAFLLDTLIRYALSPDFKPKTALGPDYLKTAADRIPTPPSAPRANGFAGMVSCTNEPMEYTSHRDFSHRCWYVRQMDGTHRMEWQTAPVNAGQEKVSLVWTGAMGYASEPSGSFMISLNGKTLIDCNVSLESKRWTSADGTCELLFDVRNANNQDAFGVMYLTVPAAMLEPGKPARISVTASNTNSRRWFMVLDYGDTLEHEGL